MMRRTAPRVVINARPGDDWNTCGQAAIATVLAHFRLGPFTPTCADDDTRGAAHRARAIDDGAAIDAVRRRFPADLPLGLGTTPSRIAAALRAHGLAALRLHSGWGERGAPQALERLSAHVRAGYPVPVCLDDGLAGGPPLSHHWAVVTGWEDGRVQLGNFGLSVVTLDRFSELWRCRRLPYGHRHSAVLAWA